ncbi:MAG: threonine ammonia-lyase [Acidimicrobiales bacterium]|nr:threonine ammonia-lyase [Acidimicrobiales bacterium]
MSSEPLAVTAADVEAAAACIAPHVVRTHSDLSLTLSSLTGTEVVVKFENLQFTGSFKDRGAANRLARLDDTQRRRGVLAVSAGNHAQGVAYHARRLGIPVTICMPTSAPFAKIQNTEALGAQVVLVGRTYADTAAHAAALVAEHDLELIHPYDDAHVIAGQGTVGLELIEDHPELDAIVVPCGGGGLLAGMAAFVGERRPDIELIGVQTEAYPAMCAAFEHQPPPVPGGGTLADGIAVKTPGELTVPIVRRFVSSMLVVPEADIERAVALLIEIEKTVAEGAGAASLAALLAFPERFRDRRVAVVLSGGNIDARTLGAVLERNLVRDGRLSGLDLTLDDLPGQLAPVLSVVAEAGANLVEIEHRRIFDRVAPRQALVHLVLETRDRAHLLRVVEALGAAGYEVRPT